MGLAQLLLPLLLLLLLQLSVLSMLLPIPQPLLHFQLLPPLLMLLPLLPMLLPQLLLLQLPTLLLQLLPQSLVPSAPSSKHKMSLATLLMDTRTSTLPSKSRAMLTEVSPDLTLMPMRLEFTQSTMLLMTLDSVLLAITSQSHQYTMQPSQLLQSTPLHL